MKNIAFCNELWCFARTRVNLFPEVEACVKSVSRPKDTGNVAACA